MQWWACSSLVSAPLPAKAGCERIVLLLVLLVSGLFWKGTLLHTAHCLCFKASGLCNHVYGRRKNIFQVDQWRLFPWESQKCWNFILSTPKLREKHFSPKKQNIKFQHSPFRRPSAQKTYKSNCPCLSAARVCRW